MKLYIFSNRRMLNIIYLFLGCELLGASCFGRDLPVIRRDWTVKTLYSCHKMRVTNFTG